MFCFFCYVIQVMLKLFPFLLSLLLVCLAAPTQVINPRACCPHTTNDPLATMHKTQEALAPTRCLIFDNSAIRVVAITGKLHSSHRSRHMALHELCLVLIGRLPSVLPLYDVLCLVGDLSITHARFQQHGAGWIVTFSVTCTYGWNLNKISKTWLKRLITALGSFTLEGFPLFIKLQLIGIFARVHR